MNYIQKQKAKIEVYETSIKELRAYLQSSKFHKDQSVNVADILLRLNEMEQALFRIN